jgi:hypothetical protein
LGQTEHDVPPFLILPSGVRFTELPPESAALDTANRMNIRAGLCKERAKEVLNLNYLYFTDGYTSQEGMNPTALRGGRLIGWGRVTIVDRGEKSCRRITAEVLIVAGIDRCRNRKRTALYGAKI